jgi:hypothetical protein
VVVVIKERGVLKNTGIDRKRGNIAKEFSKDVTELKWVR